MGGTEVRSMKVTRGHSMTEGNIHVHIDQLEPSSHTGHYSRDGSGGDARGGVKMTVRQLGRWSIVVSAAQYLDEMDDETHKMYRVDVNIHPLSESIEKEAVAPHGLIGQSFDGDNLAISGRKDDYNKPFVVTSAQAEGAIEGSWEEYIMSSPFSTIFKYSRYAAVKGLARDVTKLAGPKSLRPFAPEQAMVWA